MDLTVRVENPITQLTTEIVTGMNMSQFMDDGILDILDIIGKMYPNGVTFFLTINTTGDGRVNHPLDIDIKVPQRIFSVLWDSDCHVFTCGILLIDGMIIHHRSPPVKTFLDVW
jgi:hypothetical protein